MIQSNPALYWFLLACVAVITMPVYIRLQILIQEATGSVALSLAACWVIGFTVGTFFNLLTK